MSTRPNSEPQLGVFSRAACRVDFAGGTVDIWPLYLFHPGAVTVNVAVDIQTSCRVTPVAGRSIELISADTGRRDRFSSLTELMTARWHQHALAACLVKWFVPRGGFVMETHSESPAGAGISGSSALMIASTAALARYTGVTLDREQIRVIAQNVEAQLIRVPTGCQDYYPPLYGGANAVHLRVDGIHREQIDVDVREMERRFVLAYTGAPRQSGINNWEVFKAHVDGDRKVHRNFDRITEIARAMHIALAAADWDEVEHLLREEWKLRRTNAPGIATPLIDRLISTAGRNGGRAAKVCGAGGGGCVVFFVEPDAHARVQSAVAEAGGTILPFKIARRGVTVEVAQLSPVQKRRK